MKNKHYYLGFTHTHMPDADSLFPNNYLTGCFAKEIKIRGIGRDMGKERESKYKVMHHEAGDSVSSRHNWFL